MVAELRSTIRPTTCMPAYLPTCGPSCRLVQAYQPGQRQTSWLLACDGAWHEQLCPSCATAPGLIETGALTIDSRQCRARVEGRDVVLSAYETRVLLVLAARIDAVVPWRTLLLEAWGEDYVGAATWESATANVRTVIGRLRRRLGRAGRLIVTQTGLGVRLVAAPVEGIA